MNLKNKVNEQGERTQNHRYRAGSDGCQMGGACGAWVRKVEGLRGTDWHHRAVVGT